jgi:hypothetical protein
MIKEQMCCIFIYRREKGILSGKEKLMERDGQRSSHACHISRSQEFICRN